MRLIESLRSICLCILVLGVALGVSTCTKKSKRADSAPVTTTSKIDIEVPTDDTPPPDDSTTDLVVTAPISGTITSSTNAGALNLGATLTALGLTSDDCSSGTFVTRAIGRGEGNELVSQTEFSDASFSIPPVPVSDEVIVEFSCSSGQTIRCLAKAGDNGILCNAIADSVLASFEYVLNRTIYDERFAGRKISKIGSSIVDATKMSSDETDLFKTDIEACKTLTDDTTKRGCYKTAIEKSPFNASFKIMQQMAGDWNVEGLFILVTDILGMRVKIDTQIYSEMMAGIDGALGITFVQDVKTLLASVVTAQQQKAGTYPFKITCLVSINSNARHFDPTLNGSNQVVCDSTQATEILQNAGFTVGEIAAALEGNWVESSNCTDPSAISRGSKCSANVEMTAVSLNSELDRNDREGTNRTPSDNPSVSLIDVMPQIITAFKKYGIDASKGPPKVDMNDAAAVQNLYAALQEGKDYFVGLLGVYRFLNEADFRDTRLSLNDMHEIFVGDGFLRTRLTGWGPGYNGVEIQGIHFPPILEYDSATDGFKLNQLFKSTSNNDGTPIPTMLSAAQINSIFENSSLPFSHTLDTFTRIPNSKEIENFVFSSSHHEEWNPVGQKYIYVAQYKDTGIPITCKMANYGQNFQLIDGTVITCDTAYTGVTCGQTEEGRCTFPAGYEYPFLLFERGWYGDDQGRMFVLGSRKNGREVGMGGSGRGVMVKEYKSGNPAGKCTSSQIGQVIEYTDKFWCGSSNECFEKVRAYCMDMSALGTPPRVRFYPGGQYTVSGTDSMGKQWSWDVPLIGVYNGTDHKQDHSACLQVPQGAFFTSSTGNSLADKALKSSSYVNLAEIEEPSIINCSTTAASGTSKYYLFQWKDFSGGDTPYAYLLDASNNVTLQWKREPGDGENWDATNVRFSKSDIESLLSGETVSGSAANQINGMKFVNPMHDPKYDPYCDDINGNGYCDCYALETMSADRQTVTYKSTIKEHPEECSLMDKAAEPTLSQLPYCPNCGGESVKAEAFFGLFGGKVGSELAGVQNYLTLHQVNLDFQSFTICQYAFAGDETPRFPKYINWGHWDEATHPGCPSSNGAVYASNSQGPVRIMSVKPMKNAFNIGMPNTMIKLINFATKTVGQEIEIAADEKAFSLEEVMALMTLRFMMPPENLKILTPNGTEVRNFMAKYEPIKKPGSYVAPFTSILKGIMYKAGRFSLEEATTPSESANNN